MTCPLPPRKTRTRKTSSMTDSRAIEGLCELSYCVCQCRRTCYDSSEKKAPLIYFLSKKEKLFNFQHSLNGAVLLDSQPNVSEKVLGLFCCESVVQWALAKHSCQPQLQWPNDGKKHRLWAGCPCGNRQWEVRPSPYYSTARARGCFFEEVQ